MELKNRLYNYPSLMQEVAQLNEEIQFFQTLKYESKITQSFDGVPSGKTNAIKDPTMNQVLKMDDLYQGEIQYNMERIKQLLAEKRDIEHLMQQLTATEKGIIEKRYFKKLTWNEIVDAEIYGSCRTLQSIHNIAMKKLEAVHKH